jgi:hypothetical protein
VLAYLNGLNFYDLLNMDNQFGVNRNDAKREFLERIHQEKINIKEIKAKFKPAQTV